MSLRIPAIFMVISLLVFSACCSSKQGDGSLKTQNNVKADTLRKESAVSKTVIQDNSSVITGEILEVRPEGQNSFTIRVLIKEVEDDASFESLAAKGEVYLMKPGFSIDGKEIKPTDKNRKLLQLKDLSPGSLFRARVSLNQSNEWIVREVLNAKKPDNKQ